MNIKGMLLILEKNLPAPENFVIFKDISEIPKTNLEKYGEEKLLAMRGFDERIKISENPYKIINPKIHGFSKEEIYEKFKEINQELDKFNIPSEKRVFIIARVFYDKDVEFSGHAFRKDDKIYIDLLKGNRPSGKDWTPDLSFQIDIINNRPMFSSLKESGFNEYLSKISKDILKFDDNAYLDFTKFKSGYFFYHDLSIH